MAFAALIASVGVPAAEAVITPVSALVKVVAFAVSTVEVVALADSSMPRLVADVTPLPSFRAGPPAALPTVTYAAVSTVPVVLA
ncbi:hypothetical protein SDC9_172457 [bioreactor metagenome]|uniref:Uncharacterized protein n=1 Tax=bioreactor metagenome TaxID=1076179 RepID=A0A645GG01_9ZZZZ